MENATVQSDATIEREDVMRKRGTLPRCAGSRRANLEPGNGEETLKRWN